MGKGLAMAAGGSDLDSSTHKKSCMSECTCNLKAEGVETDRSQGLTSQQSNWNSELQVTMKGHVPTRQDGEWWGGHFASTSGFHSCTHMFIHMHTPCTHVCTHIRFGTGIRGERSIHNNLKQQKSKKRPNVEGKITIQLKYWKKSIEEHKRMWEILSVWYIGITNTLEGLYHWSYLQFQRNPINIPITFFREPEKKLSPYRNKKPLKYSEQFLGIKGNAGENISALKLYCRSIVTKPVWFWHKIDTKTNRTGHSTWR